ncbi:MAG TPA: winged helix-turn-helix domain-containing protein [Vicinamibacterales bacterium]|jgi:DNA-binding winged helix-turn-helix (wHTH) protein/TolB-like protein|nr:winged helix-turn-helix domain-containing protein [Vicinamibacterales bacterium]
MPLRYRFGQFEFESATGELTRGGTPVRLQPQPARVLALLVERAGAIVTRDEIRRHVWGDETFVDFERGLNFCIAQIRSALGDTADSPRYVETIPKRGYRFIAPVADARETAALAPATALSEDRPGAATYARFAAIGAILAVAAAAALFVVWQWTTRASAAVAVAVVPFDNQTGSAEYDRIAEGLADATVAGLAKWPGPPRLAVVGNAAILRRTRGFRDIKAIGAELGVEYVVLGQVQRDGERVRVVGHLVRTSDERHLWANRFDRPALTLAVQAEIADVIVREVGRRLQPSD